MTAIADQSTIAPGWPGWCLIAGAILFLAACALIHNANHSPITGPDTSNLDRRDGITTRCLCGDRATLWVRDAAGMFKVCPACANDGAVTLDWELLPCAHIGCDQPGLSVRQGFRVCVLHDPLATPEFVLDVAAEDFAHELAEIEAFANGEAS